MKEKDEKKKPSEFLAGIKQKATDIGKKTVDGVQKGAKAISEQTKKSLHEKKIKKYNPLFPKDLKRKDFNLPNVIKIVDDAERREIDVCEGSIGWTKFENNVEVLFLYDEAVKSSGIEFVPVVGCDQVYYVDHFNRNRFIQVNCIFERTQSEKLAELERIAYSLGAKSCLIKIEEKEVNSYTFDQSKKINRDGQSSFGGKVKDVSAELNKHSSASMMRDASTQTIYMNQRSGESRTFFAGNSTPVCPELKWFACDDNIKGLIEMRCSEANSICSKTLVLEGATSATMSQSVAHAIDCLVQQNNSIQKMKAGQKNLLKYKGTLEEKSIKECNSKLIFEIEF